MLPSLPVKLTVNMSRWNIHISLLRGLCWQVRLNSPNVVWKLKKCVIHKRKSENDQLYLQKHTSLFTLSIVEKSRLWFDLIFFCWSDSIIANIWDWVGVTGFNLKTSSDMRWIWHYSTTESSKGQTQRGWPVGSQAATNQGRPRCFRILNSLPASENRWKLTYTAIRNEHWFYGAIYSVWGVGAIGVIIFHCLFYARFKMGCCDLCVWTERHVTQYLKRCC